MYSRIIVAVAIVVVCVAAASGPTFGAACTGSETGELTCDRFVGRTPGPGTPNAYLQQAETTPTSDILQFLNPQGTPIARVDKDATGRFIQPVGSFSKNATMTFASTTTAYPVTFDGNDHLHGGVTHSVNDSKIYLPKDGLYEIVVSAIAATSTNNVSLELWFRDDGVDIPGSNTIVSLSSSNITQTLAVALINEFRTTDAHRYFEVVARVSSTNAHYLYTPAGTNPTRPSTPSFIVTVKYIGD